MKYFYFILLVTLLSCGEKHYYSQTQEIGSSWSYNNPVIFDLDISDTTSRYDMFLDLQHRDEFEYKNIYVKINTLFPDNKNVDNIVSLNIGNNHGGFLGECNRGKCVERIEFKKNFKFKDLGKHTISINQHSRKEDLKHISSLTLILDKK